MSHQNSKMNLLRLKHNSACTNELGNLIKSTTLLRVDDYEQNVDCESSSMIAFSAQLHNELGSYQHNQSHYN